MKQFAHTMRVVFGAVKENARAEKAYIGNFWYELSSTGLYVITFIIFVDLLYRRAGNIAGFTKNDFLFMTLVGQLTFYVVTIFIVSPMRLLVERVRSGNFDLMLLKPTPIKTLLYASAIRPYSALLTSTPNILLFCLIIRWNQLDLALLPLLGGVLVWLCGLIIFNTMIFALAYPVFVQGDATDMINLHFSTMHVIEMPFNKLPFAVRALSFVMLPALLMTGGATQIMLSKGPSPYTIILPSIFAAAVSALIFSRLWKKAISNYTSASS